MYGKVSLLYHIYPIIIPIIYVLFHILFHVNKEDSNLRFGDESKTEMLWLLLGAGPLAVVSSSIPARA